MLLQDQHKWGLDESSILVQSSSIQRIGLGSIMQLAQNLLCSCFLLVLQSSFSLDSLQTPIFPPFPSFKKSRVFHKQLFGSYKFCNERSTKYKNHYNLSTTEEATNFYPYRAPVMFLRGASPLKSITVVGKRNISISPYSWLPQRCYDTEVIMNRTGGKNWEKGCHEDSSFKNENEDHSCVLSCQVSLGHFFSEKT